MNPKPLTIIAIIFIITGSFLYLLIRRPQFIAQTLETNVSPTSTTLVWFTNRKTHGSCVYIYRPSLKFVCEPRSLHSANHRLTLDNLKPDQTYSYLISSGLNFRQGAIEPRPIPEELPAPPNPAYGQLQYPATKLPMINAIIIAQTPNGLSSTRSTSEGRWTLDLMGQYPQNTQIPLNIILPTQNQFIANEFITIGQHQPTQTLPRYDYRLSTDPNIGIVEPRLQPITPILDFNQATPSGETNEP